MDKFLKRAVQPPDSLPTSASDSAKAQKKRKYSEDYMQYGFTWCGSEEAPNPHCVVCGEQLGNQAMVPSKLIRHLKTKHSTYSGKDKDFFQRIWSQNKKQKQFMKSTFTVTEKAVEASYQVAKLIARQKKPHTIGEELIKPACLEIVGLMLGQKEAEEVRKVSLSAETIKRRIGDMSEDLLETLLNKLKTSGKFSLQIDETTDIKKQAQLLAVVRFVDGNAIAEEYLFCKKLPERTTGQDIFRVTNEFFTAHGIHWNDCVNFCTDGASAMLGKGKGFATLVKQQNPAIQVTHCCIHREALMTKVLPEELSETMKHCIDIVNFIKGRALNSRIFSSLCKEMGSEHQSLLYYTHVRWLSRGKVLARLFELRHEVSQFILSQNNHDLRKHLEDDYWVAKLAYMADICEHLNELNIKMQGREENILSCSDKLTGFKQKLALWKTELGRGSLEMFPRSNNDLSDVDRQFVVDLAQEHLSLLQQKYDCYFFTINTQQYDWIRNPFSSNAEISTEELSLPIRESFLELRNDRTLRLKFSEMSLGEFWVSIREEYKLISKAAIEILLQFSTTYLCEQSFSSLVLIKNDKRSCLSDIDRELRVALSKFEPNIQRLCSSKQAQISH